MFKILYDQKLREEVGLRSGEQYTFRNVVFAALIEILSGFRLFSSLLGRGWETPSEPISRRSSIPPTSKWSLDNGFAHRVTSSLTPPPAHKGPARGTPSQGRAMAFAAKLSTIGCAALAVVLPALAQSGEVDLKSFAVHVNRTPQQAWPGYGIYLGNGLVLTAAHVPGNVAETKPHVVIAGAGPAGFAGQARRA